MASRKRVKVLFGWTEQNEASWGIEKHVCDIPLADLAVNEDGEVHVQFGGEYLPQGVWHLSFLKAKKLCIDNWQSTLANAKRAIAEIRKQTANDFEESK